MVARPPEVLTREGRSRETRSTHKRRRLASHDSVAPLQVVAHWPASAHRGCVFMGEGEDHDESARQRTRVVSSRRPDATASSLKRRCANLITIVRPASSSARRRQSGRWPCRGSASTDQATNSVWKHHALALLAKLKRQPDGHSVENCGAIVRPTAAPSKIGADGKIKF